MRAYLTPRLRLSAFAVMAGLAPAIHAAPPAARLGRTAVKVLFSLHAVDQTIVFLLISLTSWQRG
jgi:hypothetical protein